MLLQYGGVIAQENKALGQSFIDKFLPRPFSELLDDRLPFGGRSFFVRDAVDRK